MALKIKKGFFYFRRLFFKINLSPAKVFFVFNLIIIISVFALGFNSQAFRQKISINDLAFYNNRFVIIRGRVCEEAEVDVNSRRVTVCALRLNLSSQKIKGRVLIRLGLYPAYDYGDFLKIRGRLQAPPQIIGFDYNAYLARYGIYSVMYYPRIYQIKGSLNWSQVVYRQLLNFKQSLKKKIDSALPEPEAGLAGALLLGYRRSLLKSDLNIFARAGLSHLIAISGTHITILSALIINFFLIFGFRRRQALKIVFIFLFLYPIITGLGASAIRASIMGSLSFLAIYYQRSSSLIKALVFSAALMLIFNPQILRHDIGFQLSFLALLGIIYIYPLGNLIIDKILKKIKLRVKTKKIVKIILETFNLTIVAQIVILPVALINFKQISLIAPVSNLLVLWAFPFLLASLIVALVLSTLIPIGSVFWFMPAYFFLKFIFIVANLLASLNWSALKWTNFNWSQGAWYYFILVLLIYFLSVLKNRRY